MRMMEILYSKSVVPVSDDTFKIPDVVNKQADNFYLYILFQCSFIMGI